MYNHTAMFRRTCAPQDECIAESEVEFVHAPTQQTKNNIKQQRKKKEREKKGREREDQYSKGDICRKERWSRFY